jgi:hypothetical protein
LVRRSTAMIGSDMKVMDDGDDAPTLAGAL